MTDLTAQILKDCYSRSEALNRLHQISHNFAKELFVDKKARKLDHDFELPKGITQKNFDEEVAKSEEEIKNMALLTLYIPIDLSYKEIAEIGEKLRKDYKEEFLLDLRVDPTLIAGCALVWKGKMRDFSFKRKLQEKHDELRKLILN